MVEVRGCSVNAEARLLSTYLGVHGDVVEAVGADGCSDGRKGALSGRRSERGAVGRSEETMAVSVWLRVHLSEVLWRQ